MPNGHEKKEYGYHEYPGNRDSRINCRFGCGCWMGPSGSGGLLGLDPVYGKCPNNPLDGQRRGGDIDYRDVVEQRIQDLERRACQAENLLKQVEPDKAKLAEELTATKTKLVTITSRVRQISKASSNLLDFMGD